MRGVGAATMLQLNGKIIILRMLETGASYVKGYAHRYVVQQQQHEPYQLGALLYLDPEP